MSGIGFGLDSSVLLGVYQSQLTGIPSAIAASNRIAASLKPSRTADEVTPWSLPQLPQSKQDAKVLALKDYIDTSKVPRTANTADAKVSQDNQNLFALYSAVNTLAYMVKMAQRSTATAGQMAGLNERLQIGLQQVQDFIAKTDFNNFALQAAASSDNAVSSAAVPTASLTYKTKTLATGATIDKPLSGLSSSDHFTVSVKKGGVTTDLDIDLSQVTGDLTLGNIVSYVNGQLSANGFSTRFQKVASGETATSNKNASYSLQITPGGVEQVSLSAASAPALYMVGNTGSATATSTRIGETTTDAAADQQARLTKLTGIDSNPSAVFSVNTAPTSGNTTAQASAVDGNGNIYVIGTATGDLGNQLNQGTQDAFVTKYDSAGNVLWRKLLGSAGSASGYGLAVDPSGGVVITGSTTAQLSDAALSNGNTGSYAVRYDAAGNQSWVKQIPTLATNQSNAVSIDASGNIYIGGSVSGGVIGAGQTLQGKGDAWLAKLDSKGKLLAENQFGTSGADSVAATATGDDGSLYVASVQNGHAIVARYADGDITAAPAWTQDLGDLSLGGAIGGLTVSNGRVYVSGTTTNTNLTAGGQAGIAAASNGGTDAFVFALTDYGSSATADHVSYVGTGTADKAGGVTVDANGTIYLTGTTRGTFAGQQRNVQNVDNAFATALNSDGSIAWARQYGGASGQSTGAGLAIDTQGSSVLDALGLPRGAIDLNRTVDLTSQTTLRAGDSFQIKFSGAGARTATIRIDQGETVLSLVGKINAQLGSTGKASSNYASGANGLKIKVNPGKTIELVAGPANFDALARLGITPGTLTAAAKDAKGNDIPGDSDTTAFGLGLSGAFDISTRMGANAARSKLLSVLSNVQKAYQKTNQPPAFQSVGNTSGKASPYLTSQLGSYNLALSLLGGS